MSTIQDRFSRVQMYFPDSDLQKAVTAGVSTKDAQKITEVEAQQGLREGNWGYNVLTFAADGTIPVAQRMTIFSKYIQAITALEQKPKFWEVDTNIHVRLAWKLSLDEERFFQLDPQFHTQIETICTFYKKEIAALAAKKEKNTAEFKQIFSDAKYAELHDVVLKPRAKYLTPKDCKNILKVQDPAKQLTLVTLFLEGLKQRPDLETAQKLASEFEKALNTNSSLPTSTLTQYRTLLAQVPTQVPQTAMSSSSSQANPVAQ